MATDFEIVLEDRPGELARVGEALGNAGVDIEGIAGFGFEGRGIIHLVVEDAAAARSALGSAGVSVNRESEAMVTELPAGAASRPGEMGRMARAVADAGVNFEAIYLATGNRAVAVTSDNEKTRATLM
jgi:hypothetical protein